MVFVVFGIHYVYDLFNMFSIILFASVYDVDCFKCYYLNFYQNCLFVVR